MEREATSAKENGTKYRAFLYITITIIIITIIIMLIF